MIHAYEDITNFWSILKWNHYKNPANWGAVWPKLSTDLKTQYDDCLTTVSEHFKRLPFPLGIYLEKKVRTACLLYSASIVSVDQRIGPAIKKKYYIDSL